MTLGSRIKECRLKARLSQEKVAELVGVSRQAVTKWESDISAPNTDNLFRLAEVLGTSVDFLITSESDNRSVAEQVYQLFKDEEARKEAERIHQKKLNFRTFLLVCAAYLLIFLLGKIFWSNGSRDQYTILGWLTSTDPLLHEYLFGWLIAHSRYLVCSLISILPALFGKRLFSVTTLAGFAIGLPLGEYLGNIPSLVPAGYHYGWAIWGGIFLGSIFLGIWLQKFKPEELTFGCKKLRLWCIISAVYVIAVIVFVLLNIPPAYY